MTKEENLLRKTAVGFAGAAITVKTAQSTSSYNRIIGANDRINIGFLGLRRQEWRTSEYG